LKKYQRTSSLLAPRELLAINPLGKAPVITDGAVTLSESGAIVGALQSLIFCTVFTYAYESLLEYLITKYSIGKGQPPESGKLDNLYCASSQSG
jgi:glutathione S-transferase